MATPPRRCASFALDYELFDEGSERLVARGQTVQVMIDPKPGRPGAIAPELRERLRSFASTGRVGAGVRPSTG